VQAASAPAAPQPALKPAAAPAKVSNPGALDVLGDFVESTAGQPADSGLLATKGSLKQRQQPSKGAQIVLSVAQPPARQAPAPATKAPAPASPPPAPAKPQAQPAQLQKLVVARPQAPKPAVLAMPAAAPAAAPRPAVTPVPAAPATALQPQQQAMPQKPVPPKPLTQLQQKPKQIAMAK